MLIDKEALYWFFSTLIQAFAAILSIVGFFIVFRIQSLKNIIDSTERDLKSLKSEIEGFSERTLLKIQLSSRTEMLNQVKEYLDNLRKEHQPETDRIKAIKTQYNSIHRSLNSCENSISNIKKRSKNPLIAISAAIFFWILCLGFNNLISKECLSTSIIFFLSLISSGVLIYLVTDLIIKSIKEKVDNIDIDENEKQNV